MHAGSNDYDLYAASQHAHDMKRETNHHNGDLKQNNKTRAKPLLYMYESNKGKLVMCEAGDAVCGVCGLFFPCSCVSLSFSDSACRCP